MLCRSLPCAIVGAALVTACGTTGPDDNIGLFTLTTADGKPVPAVVAQTSTETREVVSGDLTLTRDRRAAGSVTLRRTRGADIELDDVSLAGTFTEAEKGAIIHLVLDRSGPSEGLLITRSGAGLLVFFEVESAVLGPVFSLLLFARQ